MKRLRTIILTVALCALPVCMSAKTERETPSYRQKGYAGSISIADMFIYFAGLDTSHGYMFNEHHYIGGGLEMYFTPTFWPAVVSYIEPYIEYKAYFLKRGSTPTASIRAGYCVGAIVDRQVEKPDVIYADGMCFELNPALGWDWGLKNGKGLTLSLGAQLMLADYEVLALPKISFGFCF